MSASAIQPSRVALTASSTTSDRVATAVQREADATIVSANICSFIVFYTASLCGAVHRDQAFARPLKPPDEAGDNTQASCVVVDTANTHYRRTVAAGAHQDAARELGP